MLAVEVLHMRRMEGRCLLLLLDAAGEGGLLGQRVGPLGAMCRSTHLGRGAVIAARAHHGGGHVREAVLLQAAGCEWQREVALPSAAHSTAAEQRYCFSSALLLAPTLVAAGSSARRAFKSVRRV